VKSAGVCDVFDQPLNHSSARGSVLDYRVHIIRQGRSSNLLFPADNQTSLSISNLSNDEEYFIAVDARTQAGYNDSLHLQTLYIPTSVQGLLEFVVSSACSYM